MTQDSTQQSMKRPEENPVMKRVLDETDMYYEDHRDRERTLLQRYFPDRQQRQIEMARHKTVKARYEFLMKAMQIDHQAQLQGIQEMYNDFLIKGKAQIRKDRDEFFQNQLEILMSSLTRKSQEFSERLSTAYQELERIKIPILRERQEQLLLKVSEGYYATAERLMTNFRNILNEEIDRPEGLKNSQDFEE